jgi:hypothetical protein
MSRWKTQTTSPSRLDGARRKEATSAIGMLLQRLVAGIVEGASRAISLAISPEMH